MRSYSEVIDKCGKRLFGKYMSGSNDLRIDGTYLISYIYDVPEAQVMLQIEQVYKAMKNAYYERINK